MGKYHSVSVENTLSPLKDLNDFDKRKLCATFIYEFDKKTKSGLLHAHLGYYKLAIPLPYLVHCLECWTNKKEKLYIVQLPKTVNQVFVQKELGFIMYDVYKLSSGNAGSSSSG